MPFKPHIVKLAYIPYRDQRLNPWLTINYVSKSYKALYSFHEDQYVTENNPVTTIYTRKAIYQMKRRIKIISHALLDPKPEILTANANKLNRSGGIHKMVKYKKKFTVTGVFRAFPRSSYS